MSKNTLPVIAAIPNYNMADSLTRLLPQVLEQEYAGVYVLDDASTDGSLDMLASFGNDVNVVKGTENLCSGGNRNRILSALSRDVIIHFLDADTELVSSDNPDRAKELIRPETGFIGGLVTDDVLRKQSPWNYGPRQTFYADVGGVFQAIISEVEHSKPKAARITRRATSYFMKEWPDRTVDPVARDTFWVHEANMLIESAKFAKIGGFDTNVRSHDIQDLAIRSQHLGLVSTFNPSISVIQHASNNVREGQRQLHRLRAEWYIARKNGLLQWLLPDGHLKPRYNQ